MQDSATTLKDPLIEQDLLPFLLTHHLESGHSISLWQMPKTSEKHLLICSAGVRHLDDISLEDSGTGFVFAPFDAHQKKIFLKSDLIYTFRNGELVSGQLPEEALPAFQARRPTEERPPAPYYPSRMLPSPRDAEDYRTLVQQSVDFIREGHFEKVVPSRFSRFALPEGFDVWKTFNRLCITYPHCMVSLVSSEETGTWMGATPELLASVDEHQHFHTVALAGTKRNAPHLDLKSVAWTEKEIEEQALVCRYIISCFKKIRLREYVERGPRTAVAGNLLHLKTEYDVDMVSTNFPQLGSIMLKLLHPTSAVCGMPLEPAHAFLLEKEGYDRQYYSGFLGPVNFRNESHLFVNLRCMQLDRKDAVLYAGAGVTIDSIPEREWEETQMKLETLLTVLQ